ncbi:MAG: hypothetical protein R3236_03460, partial [Phycisphaeraceae bacterium]|nr:hypothetical protein [Phycisphaeraceae bacterium]
AFDTVVPYRRCGLALREAMGGPKTLVVPAGHYSSILFLPWIEAKTVCFFRSHFQQTAQSARSSAERAPHDE